MWKGSVVAEKWFHIMGRSGSDKVLNTVLPSKNPQNWFHLLFLSKNKFNNKVSRWNKRQFTNRERKLMLSLLSRTRNYFSPSPSILVGSSPQGSEHTLNSISPTLGWFHKQMKSILHLLFHHSTDIFHVVS